MAHRGVIDLEDIDSGGAGDAELRQAPREDGIKGEIVIVGTAHVSEKSVQEVTQAIEDLHPDIVAVELCQGRYRALTGQEEDGEIQIKEILSGGKLYLLLVQWFLAYIQKKIGSDLGVKPGSEMIAAIEVAERTGARVALVDRDIAVTIQRFWSAMSLLEKAKLFASMIPAAFGRGDEIDIEKVTEEDVVSAIIEEFREVSPGAAQVLIDERDAYIARNLIRLGSEGRVVAVVGAGHRDGITKYLAHPEKIPPFENMTRISKRRISAPKLFGAALMLLVVVTIAAVLISSTSAENIFSALKVWFLVNGVLSALGVILARGHPLSALTAFMIAWLTSLNPLMAAGWFAGIVEAWKRKPTMADTKKLADAETFKELMAIPLFRVILVAALANIGSVAGTVLGAYLILRMSGLSPDELIGGIL
ncbi:MAG: TraB/GumN family protein [Methanothrix sp.]|jgi:pheromone shutdown-related protein TraB|uniref:TraB family protein n=1 Tax=Methanothrix harundinacea TaxID=301375 RepID=A0A117MBY2_9EURY|nr:MAG: TraB family protein [Methanothrix harundinacea]KUK95589.1 MAG: TraB family protein [Methanothrix harundinacea]MDD2637342.1 TraB/GumN family protein [Methanothrix sp.]